MKHSYTTTCECARCTKERTRRAAQAQTNAGNGHPGFTTHPHQQLTGTRRRRPAKLTGLDKWARDYYDTDGGIDQFNPEDR